MKRCERIRKFILGGYTDGELSNWRQSRVKKHLAKCKECRKFERLMLKNVISPIRGASEVTPPPQVWNNISATIFTRQQRIKTFLEDLKDRLDDIFSHPKQLAFITTVIVVFLVVGVFYRPLPADQQLVNTYIGEQEEFLASLGEDVGLVYLDTDIEDAFLGGNFL